MSNHKKLIWFNKEGDYLNFKYNDNIDKFEGDIIFHENSTDTYKTYGLYMMEKIDSFEYDFSELTTKKFQLFNEKGIHLYGSKYKQEQVIKIEPSNNDVKFFSKWIYGHDFEKKFRIGTIIKFDKDIFEFSSENKIFTIVNSKKNAIMILSTMNNFEFENSYNSYYNESTSYENITISSFNSIGIYDYVDIQSLNNNLSEWNEPNFYDNIYLNKKINIVNSKLNDNYVVTINNININDLVHFEYYLDKNNLPNNSKLILEIINKMDSYKVYSGPMNIKNNSKIYLDSSLYSNKLIESKQIKIVRSNLDDLYYTTSSIIKWENIVNLTYFKKEDQVIFNNKLYECIQSYTHSFASQSTFFITPEYTTYWGKPTHISVQDVTTNEEIIDGIIYLANDKYYFEQDWTETAEITMSHMVEKYKDELSLFDIDFYYQNNKLKADLKYPSEYQIVNFYHSYLSLNNNIGNTYTKMERIIGVEEELNYELNYDYSENYSYNIIFTDIDNYGIKIYINGMAYEEELLYITNGDTIDMDRTIDNTLRSWFIKHYVRLYTLGINTELKYTGNNYSSFYNTIYIETEYPNVPMKIDKILVGTTAKYYIEHSTIIFNNMGPYLNIKINDIDYGISTTVNNSTNIVNINETLNNWVSIYQNTLSEFDILVNNVNNLLKFDILDSSKNLKYEITTGKINLPGISDFIINNKIKGNHGLLLASNELLLPKSILNEQENIGFEKYGFSTGMLVSINNTMWPLVNREYVIQYLDPTVINLSYEGPFWGLTNSICNSSAFVTLAFDNGFTHSICEEPMQKKGQFDPTQFNSAFSIKYSENDYILSDNNLSDYINSEMIDIYYIQISNCVYILTNNIIVIDSYTGIYIKTIILTNNTNSIKILYNNINDLVYCLCVDKIFIINPVSNELDNSINNNIIYLNNSANDLIINELNGDVYVTYNNSQKIDIWPAYNFGQNPIKTLNSNSNNWPSSSINRCGNMVFNDFEKSIYLTTDDNFILKINSNREIQTSFEVYGLTNSIFYEPINESIYAYGDFLYKIDNNNLQKLSLPTQEFNSILFNKITGDINISDSSFNFTKLDISTNNYTQKQILSYGYLVLNNHDGDVYISSQNTNKILIVDSTTGEYINSIPLSAQTSKIIYNPDKKVIWSLQPSTKSIIEVDVIINSTIIPNTINYTLIDDNSYGTLDPNYITRTNIWLKTKNHIRKPRENYNNDVNVQYYWKWEDDSNFDFFMYDFSGDQLKENGIYTYTGNKPLTEVSLNRKPNLDITKVNAPEYQQTIFDEIIYTLPHIDDENEINTDVEPLQLFIGFKSSDEGYSKSTLNLHKRENITFDLLSSDDLVITLTQYDSYGEIKLNQDSNVYFTDRGLKEEQIIKIYLKDITNNKNQYISNNNDLKFKIRSVFSKTIIVDYIDSVIINESTKIIDYPSKNYNTYLKFTIKVIDKIIASFNTIAQTEDEDERFKIELNNMGKLISPDEVFIFKEYDILEGGIDWKILNRKRKEMLMTKHLIYPYIGSYKAIINSINYFGYNDLQLNEYYRNINIKSNNFLKLFKVEIPDIFDNTVDGWTENDFIKNTYPNENYEETKLFNLTYLITDKDGNNVLSYSIDEIIIKLQGLKYWMQRNVIPLTHKILDITGQAYINRNDSILHKVHDMQIISIRDNMSPITGKLNEAYLMPINSGSTVYNCVVEFYNIIPDKAHTDYIKSEIKPYNNVDITLPDSFTIKIRTYKTYEEWDPFKKYKKGDRVEYYNKIYESEINSNITINPNKFKGVSDWIENMYYNTATIVRYNKDYYVYSGNGEKTSLNPYIDEINWLKITEWKEINLEPIQLLNEFRTGDNLLPYSFTIDTSIDPYVVIEVISDNGYGEIYNDKKNYDIKSIKY